VRLSDQAPFTTLWAASSPTIPSALYGATNQREWFAELWRCQIEGSTSTFVQLAGGDRTRADALRAAFTSLLPMPAFTY
ncbi:hypothetical protein, partial [Chryseobacterium hispalense]|uniref:hypothetical protein n=1 Tax=Chryseobacterium hispalense TaxID=1453492 RepID=UPI0016202A50